MGEQSSSAVRTGPAVPRVVAVAVTPRRRKQVLNLVAGVVRSGGEALVVTADGGRGDEPAAGVTRLDLLADERRWGPNRLLSSDPRRVIAALTHHGAPQGAAPAWRRWVASRPYRVVRYWVLWRVARRHLDVLRPDQVTHVLVVGIESWPIAWHLLRSSPGATIGFDVPSTVFGPSTVQP